MNMREEEEEREKEKEVNSHHSKRTVEVKNKIK